jgi:hypothetical protein
MPLGRSLYGSLPDQLASDKSFVSGLRSVLDTRRRHDIAVATQVDVPDVAHPGMLVLVHRLDGGDASRVDAPVQVTVLNFTGETIEGTVHSTHFIPRHCVVDATTGGEIGWVDDLQSFGVWLGPYGGLFLVLTPGPSQSVD